MSNNRNKIAFVTGANGFIGSHLNLTLIKKGVKVIGFTRTKSDPFNSKLYPPDMYMQIVGDIRNRRFLEKIFAQYKLDYVFHLAARSTVEEGQREPAGTYDVNINGALNILELSRIFKLGKVIIASTSHVYGDNPNVPFKEEYFPQPSRPYETSKTCVDLIAQSYADSFGMSVEIGRFVNIYGPGDLNFTRLIPKIMKQIIFSQKVEIWGGEAVRDYLYIDDAMSAYLCLLDANNPAKNKIVNFGTGKPLSVLEVVKKIIEISKKEVEIIIKKKQGRIQEVEKQYLSLKKSQRDFRWQAKVSLNEGLTKTYTWYANINNIV